MNPRTTSVEFMVRGFVLVTLGAIAFALFRQGSIMAIIAAILILPLAGMQLLSVVAMFVRDLKTVSLLTRRGRHQRGSNGKH